MVDMAAASVGLGSADTLVWGILTLVDTVDLAIPTDIAVRDLDTRDWVIRLLAIRIRYTPGSATRIIPRLVHQSIIRLRTRRLMEVHPVVVPSVQRNSNVYSGPVAADGSPTGDLRPGMVLPDGAVVVSVGPAK